MRSDAALRTGGALLVCLAAGLTACGPGRRGDPCAGVAVDDGVACTVDACDPVSGAVTHRPDDTGCPAGQACSPVAGCLAIPASCADLAPVAGTAFHLLTLVDQGLAAPVHLSAPAGDARRLFVVEQTGRVRLVKDGVLLATPYLDLHSRVLSGGERGLLSIAFHPAFAGNGRLFVYYTAQPSGAIHISEFTASGGLASADSADPGSESVLVSIDHASHPNHNGGQVAFGPDGHLYAGIGDGGGAGDPLGSGQDTASLLGKLLRIDVDRPTVPVAGNPFGTLVYDHGLRNPWRFSFDRATGDLYVADVGQDAWEELDWKAAAGPGLAPPAGTNWGWNLMEGRHCFADPACAAIPHLALPVLEVAHPDSEAIVGGFVYRGPVMPDLAALGTYFYGDEVTGYVRTIQVAAGVASGGRDVTGLLGVNPGSPSSFGEDGCGELYLVSYGGAIHRFVPGP